MQAVMHFSQRVMCLDAGRIICEGRRTVIANKRRAEGLPWRLRLTVQALDAGYGAVRALHGRDPACRGGRDRGAARHQRQRQEHADEVRHGPGAAQSQADRAAIDGATHDLTRLPTEEIVGLGVALVPEGRRLFPKLTVEENLMLGAFRKQARGHIRHQSRLAYDTFPVLAERRKQLAGTMSGGQQQMLAIARALMSSPRLLLVDEPSVGLSPLLVSQTITKIEELKKQLRPHGADGRAELPPGVRIADRGYVIVHGEIAFEGKTVDELKPTRSSNGSISAVSPDGMTAS